MIENTNAWHTTIIRGGGKSVKMYLISLGAGVLVGMLYSLLNVRSPAPPLVALLGLLGILAGEQAIPLAKQLLVGVRVPIGWRRADCANRVLGILPGRPADRNLADPEDKRP